MGGSKVPLQQWAQATYLYASDPEGTKPETLTNTLHSSSTGSRRMLQAIKVAFEREGDPLLNLSRPVLRHPQDAQNGSKNNGVKPNGNCPAPEGGMRGTNQPCPHCKGRGTKYDDNQQEICIMCDRPVNAEPAPHT